MELFGGSQQNGCEGRELTSIAAPEVGAVEIPAISESARDWIPVLSWLAGALGVFVAAAKFRSEVQSNREQRERDLRWRQADAGKKLNDEMLDDREAYAALQMIDSGSRQFELPSKHTVVVTTEDWLQALDPKAIREDEKSVFIRDCFDSAFYYMATLEHYVQSGLVRVDDVAYPLRYYIPLMKKHRQAIDAYLETFGLLEARRLLEREHLFNGLR
jgi:hypothetical protein